MIPSVAGGVDNQKRLEGDGVEAGAFAGPYRKGILRMGTQAVRLQKRGSAGRDRLRELARNNIAE